MPGQINPADADKVKAAAIAFRTLNQTTGFDSDRDLPALATFARNPNNSYDFAVVFAHIDFEGDPNAIATVRFALGYERAGNPDLRGWLQDVELATTGTVVAPLVAASVEANKEWRFQERTEGRYAIRVPVGGFDLWASVEGVVGYTYAYGWDIRLAVAWQNANINTHGVHG